MIHGLPPSSPPHDVGDVRREPKPCAARLGKSRWCCLADGHSGDHEYLSRTELPEPFADIGPQRVPRWGR